MTGKRNKSDLNEVIRYLSVFTDFSRERAVTCLIEKKPEDRLRYTHLAQAAEMIKRNLLVDHPTVLADELAKKLEVEKDR